MLELALHVLDILQNTVEAGATYVDLNIVEEKPADRLTITVTDNGCGMDALTVRRVLDPFYTTRTTRHVGLGLPLFATAAQCAGGGLAIRSEPGRGTTVEATFQLSHPDRQPLGDMAGTLLAFLLAPRAPKLRYAHRLVTTSFGGPVEATKVARTDLEFKFDSAAILAELDGLPLSQPLVVQWLAGFLGEGESELKESGF